ncbi:hypothetical protein ED733_009032 [Metarhizium rileyi]|uniref:Fungal lipase-type domain-containing protein n=1 Tax=Metarhizium rileyi (strain RCEF 4871) TaxID=1649241 RepID=A0A5C6GQF6_METRR|nr:hypothetical protein ED733_009032 [Metarhizium rileyi]
MRLSTPAASLGVLLLTSLGLATSAASGFHLDTAALKLIDTYSRYASAAYCSELHDLSTNSVVCTQPAAEACDGLADAVTVGEFGDSHSISGYIAVSQSQSVVVAAFRGTDIWNGRDILSDLLACLEAPAMEVDLEEEDVTSAFCQLASTVPPDADDKLLPLCDDCRIHQGFWAAFRGIKDDMMQVVMSQLGQNPGFKVVTTGHSLGGAVATIAGVYLRKAGIETDVYTYGSPRVGDEAFAKLASDTSNGITLRISNKQDPVTVLPRGSRTGYAHTTPEIWFPKGLHRPSRVCEGVHNRSCSGRFLNIFASGDHGVSRYAKGVDVCPTTIAEA